MLLEGVSGWCMCLIMEFGETGHTPSLVTVVVALSIVIMRLELADECIGMPDTLTAMPCRLGPDGWIRD